MAERAEEDRYLGQTLLGKYQLDQLIARGGMGRVYRATQIPLGRPCAVKVLEVSYSGERKLEFKSRFLLEAKVTSRLGHPNNITIYDYGETEDGTLFMAMELLEGVSLHRALRAHGPMPEDRVVHIAKQICRALREAHKNFFALLLVLQFFIFGGLRNFGKIGSFLYEQCLSLCEFLFS